MNMSMEQLAENSVHSSENIEQVERVQGWAAAGNSLKLAEVYEPCQGTWQEFCGDVKRYVKNAKASWIDRYEDSREGLKGFFHRDRSTKTDSLTKIVNT